MYVVYEVEEWIGIPPSVIGEDLDAAVRNIIRDRMEGQIDDELGIIAAVIDAKVVGDGIVLSLPGDPDIYFPVRYRILAFKPVLLEVVKGIVREAREQGIFVGIGPIDGFVFRNQIMDEQVEFLFDKRGFRGVESNRIIAVGDRVRARITQISKAARRAATLRIGMTMRQPYLGKEEWYEEG